MILRVAEGPILAKSFGDTHFSVCKEVVNIDGNTDKEAEVSDNSAILENSSVKGRILSSVNWSERLNVQITFGFVRQDPNLILSSFDLLAIKGLWLAPEFDIVKAPSVFFGIRRSKNYISRFTKTINKGAYHYHHCWLKKLHLNQ